VSAATIQVALGAVLSATLVNKSAKGKGGGGQAVDLGQDKQAFLVNVCGLVYRDGKYYLRGSDPSPDAPPLSSGGGSVTAAGGEGGGGGGGNCKGRLISMCKNCVPICLPFACLLLAFVFEVYIA
jgi:hypothetical protein